MRLLCRFSREDSGGLRESSRRSPGRSLQPIFSATTEVSLSLTTYRATVRSPSPSAAATLPQRGSESLGSQSSLRGDAEGVDCPVDLHGGEGGFGRDVTGVGIAERPAA